MLEVKFRYKDRYTGDNWNEQTCYTSSIEECIKFYGLGVDCEYEIISIKEVR